MRRATLVVTSTLLLSLATPAFAHRVDEYLQATTIAVEKERVHAQIRLTPGVEVFPVVLAFIDTDRDGIFSATEQRAYAERVLRDLSLSVDGKRLALRLASASFGDMELMRDGRGVIQIDFDAPVPRGGGDRRLVFENHHFSRIAEYLVNGLVPSDRDISIRSQTRNYLQSRFELDYTQAGAPPVLASAGWWSGVRGWLLAAALLPLAWLVARRARRVRVATQHPAQ
jgi:hypothetical protein